MTPDQVIRGLLQRGIPEHIALGIAGNFAVESGFNPGINEINPVVPGSRGGFGLAQWTGPRRRQYEGFAGERGAALDDLDTQLDFLVWELGNTEAKAAARLAGTKTPEEAAQVFSESFLRPGIPHLDRRIAETRNLASGGVSQPDTYQPQNTLARGQDFNPDAQQNALAQPRLQLRTNQLDPRAFMTATAPRNRLALT